MSDIVDVNTLFGPLPSASTDLTVESLLQVMGRYQVGAACALSTLGILLDPSIGNTITRAACTQFPLLNPVATLNPKLFFEDAGALERLYADGFCMVRFFPDAQGWPIDFEPFRFLVNSLRSELPVMIEIHTPGQITSLSAVIHEYTGPVLLSGVDAQTLAEAVCTLRRHENWALETSHLLSPGNIGMAVNTLGSHRVLFGTQTPARASASVLQTLKFAGLTQEAMESILSQNARRILRINA